MLEEMAIGLRSGSKKGRHVTGVFDIPALVKFIDQYTATKVAEARKDTGLVDINGKQVHLGDTIHKLYVPPFGEPTDDLDDEYYGKGEVTFENGTYCLRTKASPDPIPLHTLLKRKKGEYVPNYGNATVYSNIIIASLTNSNKGRES